MAYRRFLLKKNRRDLLELLELLDRVLVGLECGLELGYAWHLAGGLPAQQSFAESLTQFAAHHPVEIARPWFTGLTHLYREGAPLVPFFEAFTHHLRDQLRHQMEDHDRNLPFRLNLVLLLFSLPPVFVLLFGALLRALTME